MASQLACGLVVVVQMYRVEIKTAQTTFMVTGCASTVRVDTGGGNSHHPIFHISDLPGETTRKNRDWVIVQTQIGLPIKDLILLPDLVVADTALEVRLPGQTI